MKKKQIFCLLELIWELMILALISIDGFGFDFWSIDALDGGLVYSV